MTDEQRTYTFKTEDIFKNIENDPNNLNMNIPPEVADEMGWQPGDTLKILVGDQGTIIIEKVDSE